MKIKILLFMISIFAVLSLSSQNVIADCEYAYPPGPMPDEIYFLDCIKISDSGCDSSCGAWTEGCDGTKVKVKVISQCYSAPLLTSCRLLQGGDHVQVGLRYTYNDCASESVNKKCYGGACECFSNVDCTNPAKPNCDLSTHVCKAPELPKCPDGTAEGACCAEAGKRCKKDASNNLVCQVDSTCADCTAILSFPTVGTGDPCGISASISASGCDGKSYQVKEGTTSKCFGTVSGSAFSTSCSFTQSGTKTYDLYVDSAKKDTESGRCESGEQ
ncbi:MAG: hypothetical protein KJ714_07565 [Euryarchaeota archaeon]|nr:hypothetical protein [Euryarchaeota archaeon]